MKTTVQNPRNKREDKKRVNIRWNSRLGFQIGIISSILIVFFIMQASFKIESSPVMGEYRVGLEEPPMIDYVVEIDLPKPIIPQKTTPVKALPVKKITLSTVIKIEKNNSEVIETDVPAVDVPVEPTVAPVSPEPTAPEAPAGPRSIINVEHVPVYPGCESKGSNAEKIDCMSSNINTFINRNFRKSLLENLDRNQVQKIYVQFKIDSQGFITDVRANSNNEILKREAQRVIGNLPTMKPGRQGNKNVDVLYTVPIIFNIQ